MEYLDDWHSFQRSYMSREVPQHDGGIHPSVRQRDQPPGTAADERLGRSKTPQGFLRQFRHAQALSVEK